MKKLGIKDWKYARDRLPDILSSTEIKYFTGWSEGKWHSIKRNYAHIFRPISGVGKHRVKFYKKESLLKFVKDVESSNAYWKGWQNLRE